LAGLKLPQWSQQSQLSVSTARRRRPSTLEPPQRQASGDRVSADRPCCVLLHKPIEKITIAYDLFSKLVLFIALIVARQKCDVTLVSTQQVLAGTSNFIS